MRKVSLGEWERIIPSARIFQLTHDVIEQSKNRSGAFLILQLRTKLADLFGGCLSTLFLGEHGNWISFETWSILPELIDEVSGNGDGNESGC